ncbi:putative pentatricopeptide repeat-containing protein [Forsythia ovata]|uniref:Pentatricopeptide repeat-containing protein n=1 Tax=Forsythia ovata TaxID=205694 RepID=A0ABD1S6L5_9LAMI
MHSRFRLLTKSSWEIQGLLKFHFTSQPTNDPFIISAKILPFLIPIQNYHHHQTQISTKIFTSDYESAISLPQNRNSNSQIENEAVKIQARLKLQSHKSVEDIQQSLALMQSLFIRRISVQRAETAPLRLESGLRVLRLGLQSE